jgi:WD40 repeat protein
MNFILALAALILKDNNGVASLRIWDWSLNSNVNILPAFLFAAKPIKFLRNGLLVASSASSTATIWNITTGVAVFTLQLNDYLYAVEKLSNGNLATSTWQAMMQIWNPVTGGLINRVVLSSLLVVLKQISSTNYLASGHNDNNVYIWNIYTLALVSTLKGHTYTLYNLELTPSGLLLSASPFEIILWNTTLAISYPNLLSSSIALSTLSLGSSNFINNVKIVSSSKLALAYHYNQYLQFVDISANNQLSLGAQVNLPTNTYIQDLIITSQNILLATHYDATVSLMNLNTSLFFQTYNFPWVPLVLDINGKLDDHQF